MTIAISVINLRLPALGWWAVAALLGVGAQLQQSSLWPWANYLALLVVCAAAGPVVRYAPARRPVLGTGRASGTSQPGPRGATQPTLQGAVLLMAGAGLAFALVGLRASVFDAQRLDPMLEGRDLQVVGVVSDLTQSSASGLRFRLQVESAQSGGRPVQLPPRMDVGWYSGLAPRGAGADLAGWELQRQPQDLRPGQRWQFTLRIKAPHGSRNPEGFDYELWLWTQGVQATAYVRAGAQDAAPSFLGETWAFPVAALRQAVRACILERVAEPQAAGLIAALVVGDQAALERADWDVFRATGVAHLVSISGLHITMFAWGAMVLVGRLWRRSQRLCLWLPAPTAALVGGFFLALAYALFSGWGVPAQRTCLMLATVAALRVLGLRWPWPQVWLLTFMAVVVSDPWALLQAGFWLSFVAVGVLFVSGSGTPRPLAASGPQGIPVPAPAMDLRDNLDTLHWPTATQASTRPGWQRLLGTGALRLGAALQRLLGEQWTITLALAPLTVLLFGQVSVIGLLANLLAVPWVTLVLTPLALLGVLFPALWGVAALAVQGLMLVLQNLATWPGAVLVFGIPPWWLAVLAAVGGLLLVVPAPWSLRLLGMPMLLAVPLWRAPAPVPGEFELLVADVGQGNAVLVRTAQHALLYDAGPRYSLESDAGHRVLVPLLQATQTQLDRLVLSHQDADHVGGAAAVLATQTQASLLSSLPLNHPLTVGRNAQRCEAGQSWDWDGVHFEILYPRAQDYTASPPPKPNALSCVLRVAGRGQSALLVGDIERAQEAALITRMSTADGVRGLKSTLLLVPHHGSKTSSSGPFVAAVQPSVAVVQAGYRNRYGHPVMEVMDRYRALDADASAELAVKMIDTPHCGAFVWQSALPHNGVCTRTAGLRYWHHRVP